jgi:hypothetical protein
VGCGQWAVGCVTVEEVGEYEEMMIDGIGFKRKLK